MYCLAPEKMVEKWSYRERDRERGREISEKHIHIIVPHERLDEKYNHKMTTIYFVMSCTNNVGIKLQSSSHLTIYMTPILTTADMKLNIAVPISYQFWPFVFDEEHINLMISAI